MKYANLFVDISHVDTCSWLSVGGVFQLTTVDDMRNTVEALEKLSAALEEAREQCEHINREEDLFEWEMTAFPQLEAMIQAKDPYEKLWNTAYHFAVVSDQWLNGIYWMQFVH